MEPTESLRSASNPVAYTLCMGACSTGKSQSLVDAVSQLLASGADPARIALFAASPDAARELSRRLAERTGQTPPPVLASIPRKLCLEMLATDEARAYTGRKPRLLAPFELNVLLEDMKTTGLKPGRLKEMLRFFCRSWSMCDDFHDGWLINNEEVDVHSRFKGALSMTGGLLEPEAANFALRFVLDNREARGHWSFDHVFVDDFQLLSRASQLLVQTLADKTFFATGDPTACEETFEQFPHPEGLDELLALHPTASVVHLETCRAPRAIRRVIDAVVRDIAPESAASTAMPATGCDLLDGCVESVGYAMPQDEFVAIAARVESAVSDGVAPEDIFVAVPNRAWGHAVHRALGERGIGCATKPSALFGGDVRDMRHSENPRAFTLLALAADPLDGVAWRSWCGFGDPLLNSTAFDALRNRCNDARIHLTDVLDLLADSPDAEGDPSRQGTDLETLCATLGMDDVVRAYRHGRTLVERLGEMTGSRLMRALDELSCFDDEPGSRQPSRDILGLIGDVADDEGAQGVFARLTEALSFPAFAPAEGSVRVGLLEDICGLSPRLMILCGFVNGLVPPRSHLDGTVSSVDKRAKLRDRALRRLYAAVGVVRESLVVSRFAETSCATAERFDLCVARIRLKNGNRVCAIEPSSLLPYFEQHDTPVV